MPQTHPTTAAPGPLPVPVAVLLPDEGRLAVHAPPDRPETSHWYGVTPRAVAALIARYTRPHDRVIELNNHPLITKAVLYLGRRPTTAVALEDRDQRTGRQHPRQVIRRPAAGLVLAGLPVLGVHGLDLQTAVEAMRGCAALLRPGGYLLIALAGRDPQFGSRSGRVTVITAARAVGLAWQQEFIAPWTPLPEYEPRAMPETSTATRPALINGRHELIHTTLLAFCNRAGGTCG